MRILCGRSQVTELKRRGLCTVRVYTSSLLSPGSHGKSRRLTLRTGFFSGSLNGLGPGQIVRVHLLAVESFYKGVALVSLRTRRDLCQHLCSEVRRIGQIEKKSLMEGFDEISNKGSKGETRPAVPFAS